MKEYKDEKHMKHDTLKKPWSLQWKSVAERLGVNPDEGLDSGEVKKRLRRYGPNRLREMERKSALAILISQFKSLVIIILLAASAVSFAFGRWIEAIAISVAVVINGAIGFFTEIKAVRMMEALRELSKVSTKVLRKGSIDEIPAEKIVPGDVVVAEAGDIVTADIRLVEASRLQVEESSLTGESVPLGKSVDEIDADAPLAERKNMLFKGTTITRGSCKGIVVATGMNTELGRISSLVEEAEEEITPLEKRLNRLGHRLLWMTFGIASIVAIAGIVAGKELLLMVETSIALAVAAIPEGLPVVATIALAKGMWRMARRNALVNRLSSVETLGATNIIFTDKTGTLTENKMTVARVMLDESDIHLDGSIFRHEGQDVDPAKDEPLKKTLETAVLCNNASMKDGSPDSGEGVTGDPLEIALLIAGDKAGIRRDQLLERFPEVREVAFDPETKMMATVHEKERGFRIAVKGAPEAVLEASTKFLSGEDNREMKEKDRERWLEANKRLAEDGLRVLALAEKSADSSDSDPYEGLTFLSMIGMLDPPREEVRESINACLDAGIRVIMVTGDQSATAKNVGLSLGLIGKDSDDLIMQGKDVSTPEELTDEQRRHLLRTQIFARVSPEQKLDLIKLYQENNAIVAMTGDGVNDAPALKKADIGVAMGKRGTQVAREAADMVLKDDAFSTIVEAIEHGRVIFENIRKFVVYILSCHVAEIVAVSVASLINAPLPILPLQILFLNLVTDVFPALALGIGEGSPTVMKRSPRDPNEAILTRHHWLAIAGYGFMMAPAVLGSLFLALTWLKTGVSEAVTISYLTLGFASLLHVFNMRDRESNMVRNDVTRNPYVWGAVALGTVLLISTIYLPVLSGVLRTVNPGLGGWGVIVVMSLFPLLFGQVIKVVFQAKNK